jgi:membrane protease YdiL (CAAX protease family)
VIGGRWEKVEDFLLEIGIAAAFWIVAVMVLGGVAYALGMAKGGANLEQTKKLLGFLVPHTNLEIALWICVALTAGFCEEFIFRGYVQRQFSVMSGKVFVGMLVSSIVFGMAHGYEGWKRMILICVYGFLFSALVELRKSLRPGMMAHAWHDAFTGLVMRALFK